MRKIKCSGPGCEDRRVHHEKPDVPRGPQYVEVPDDYGDVKAYCSIECCMYDCGVKVPKDAIKPNAI